ncbi:uncharacterized protein TNCV_3285511 [Trichonephila clavipes]|nr:uncharacterized protein TNCV_3285511 [Trichonephila clavipes]
MLVVSTPCSCQPDCLVCGRGEVPPHDCAIHVLLDGVSRTNVARRAHRSKFGEILQSGKEYLPRAMHMTDQYSVRWQTMHHYVKSGFPRHNGNSSQR